jgi:hypothetical protein
MNEGNPQECLDMRALLMLHRGKIAKLRVIQVEQVVFSDTRSAGKGQPRAPSTLRPREIFDIENEGESHDVVENKGQNFLSHDVYDK